MALETIGFRAVVENLTGYLTGTKQMEDANRRLERAQLNLEQVTKSTAAAQNAAAASIVKARKNLDTVNRTSSRANVEAAKRLANTEAALARQVSLAQDQIAKAKARVAANANASAARQAAAADNLAAKEIRLANITAAGAERVAVAQRRVAATAVTRAERVAAAEAALQAAVTRSAVLQESSALRIKQAQLGVVATGGRLASGITRLSAVFGIFKTSGKLAETAIQKLGTALIAVTGFANRFAVSLRFGAGALTAFTAAFTIGAASSFENQLVKIDNLTNLTTEQVADLREEIIRLADSTPKSPAEIGATFYQVLNSNISDLGLAYDIARNSIEAGVGAFTDSSTVAKTTTAVIKAYGENNITAAQTTDILVAAAKVGRVEFGEFTNEIGRFLGLAPTLGIEFDELAASFAALSNFLPPSQAATALLGILNQLFDPSEEARKEFERLGTSVEEFKNSIAERGLLPAMSELVELSGRNQETLGKLFPEVRGLTGALVLMGQSFEENIAGLETIRNSAGITRENFERANKTFSAQVGLIRNQLNIALIELGSTVLPAVTQKLQEMIKWFRANREAIVAFGQQVLKIIGFLATRFVDGLKVINDALSFFPNNSGIIIAAIFAIATAIAVAFGPAGAAFIALAGIITLLGILKKELGAVEKAELPRLTQQRDDLIKKLEAQGVSTGQEPTLPLGPSGRPPTGPEAAAIQEQARKGAEDRAKLEAALNSVNTRIAELEAKEAANKLSTEGDLGISAQIEADRKKLNEELEKTRIELNQVTPAFNNTATAADNTEKIMSALSDGIIDFGEATELGLSAAQAGILEASVLSREGEEKAFNYAKAIAKVSAAFEKSADLAQKVVLDLARSGLQAAQSAASALFSRPTREIARLELALARLRLTNSSVIRSLDNDIKRLQGRLSELDERQAAADAGRAARELGDQLRELQQDLAKAKTPDERENIRSQIEDVQAQQADNGRQQAADRARKAIEDEIAKREDQIAKLQEQEASVQRQIDLFNLQNEVLQKEIQAADATLLSQGELTSAAREVARVTAEQSQIVRTLSDRLGISLIPEIDAMRDTVAPTNEAFRILNEKVGELNKALVPVIDLLKTIPTSTTTTPNTPQEGFAEGGFITRTTQATLHAPEVVLPLSDPARSRELIRSIPAALAAQIGLGSSQGSAPVIGSFTANGYVPAEVENMVVRSVRREIRKSNSLVRTGMRL